VNDTAWQASPILGVALEPDGVFQPTADEPGGVYAIVKRPGAKRDAIIKQAPRDAPGYRLTFGEFIREESAGWQASR